MSKGKITSACQEAAEQLSAALPREQREKLKRAERAFVEMRQLHSVCEQRRQEAEELAKKQAERLTAYEMFVKEQETSIHRCDQVLGRLTSLLNERMCFTQLNRRVEQLYREFQVKTFDFASQCKMTPEQWLAFIADFNRQVEDYQKEREKAIWDELILYSNLLAHCIKQHGPVKLCEEDEKTWRYVLQWKPTNDGMYLELRGMPCR